MPLFEYVRLVKLLNANKITPTIEGYSDSEQNILDEACQSPNSMTNVL